MYDCLRPQVHERYLELAPVAVSTNAAGINRPHQPGVPGILVSLAWAAKQNTHLKYIGPASPTRASASCTFVFVRQVVGLDAYQSTTPRGDSPDI